MNNSNLYSDESSWEEGGLSLTLDINAIGWEIAEKITKDAGLRYHSGSGKDGMVKIFKAPSKALLEDEAKCKLAYEESITN